MTLETYFVSNRSPIRLSTLCTLVLLLAGHTMSANAATFPVGADSHYLHAKASDTVTAPTVIDLVAEGMLAGAVIEIEQLGGVVGVDGGSDDQTSMSAVFSSTSVVTAKSDAHRVPGAVVCATCTAIVTAPTCAGAPNEATDIPEDLFISGPGSTDSPPQTVTVPIGALFLIVGVPDCQSGDNSDPNSDSMVRVDLKIKAAPTMSTLAIALTGSLLVFAAYRARKLHRA